MDQENLPLVTVICTTYNHENYIRTCLDGFLMQQTSFYFEIIVHDDASTDNTQEIIRDYELKYPGLFFNIYQIENQFSKKDVNIWYDIMIPKARGKYIAICEGDDYWIDPLKLQKQVDFLEAHPAYSMTCHNALIKYEESNKKNIIFNERLVSCDFSMENIVEKWIIPTASMVYRKEYVLKMPDWIYEIYSGDFTLALLLRNHGKIWFFKDIMSIYRVNYSGSSATSLYNKKEIFVLNQHILLLEYFNDYTEFKYSKIITLRILQIRNDLKYIDLKSRGFFYLLKGMPITILKKIMRKLMNGLNKILNIKYHV